MSGSWINRIGGLGLDLSTHDKDKVGFFFLYLRLLISTGALPSGYTTGYLESCLHWVVSKMFTVYLILPLIC